MRSALFFFFLFLESNSRRAFSEFGHGCGGRVGTRSCHGERSRCELLTFSRTQRLSAVLALQVASKAFGVARDAGAQMWRSCVERCEEKRVEYLPR
ncbi:hypothetical protein IWX90DRAFT_425647 [Phyllosticta citrichinensis]|uniref:Secreted protein n=1 Tax=Phyllosticta citrichinensis TaxID=1130410 RepID=A0ABR1Y466_9PEZI